ncbi:sensor domain-containing diguanylate cyclase [Desulfoferula mesophila]|uniref:GGDEF domain-containing protein n=1 Tax=Desulfoferula mesophila TaxID=3058419 RepID=A0AAU9ETN0_9BACT|nr:GGDEF domain-containing protein [Desulfoferula mesophilus]
MKAGNQKKHTVSTKGVRLLFFIIFVSVGTILAGIITFIYQLETEGYFERLKEHESFAVKVSSQLTDKIFEDVTADLKYLSQQQAVLDFFKHNQKQDLEIIAQDFFTFSKVKNKYDQVRLLNAQGMEIVRVNYDRGHPAIVSRDQLQNKAKRYYFADTFAMGKGEVFVSPFDLNIENGVVEKPLKPMIRFGMVVFDPEGNKRGVVLLNYLGDRLLKLLEQAGKAMFGQPLLLNRKGYWIMGPQKSDDWGFMLAGRENKTIYNRFPVSAATILSQHSGQLYNKEGMFSFANIYPLKVGQQSSCGAAAAFERSTEGLTAEQYHWILISYMSPDNVKAYSFGLLTNLAILGSALFLLTALASWLIAGAIVRKRLYRAELYKMAHFDELTKLPNRALFYDRLNQTYETCKRYDRSFALLNIDLDDFKNVNDSLGHGAGDMLLKEVSGRMLGIVRKSDTVARMGGDEFMIILAELPGPQAVEAVAQKLLDSLTKPVVLDGQQAQVGACIGSAIYPDDSTDLAQLIKMADMAMYACKAEGKNMAKTYSSLSR